MITITITENQANQRVDRFLKKYMPKAPLSLIYKTIRTDLKVNGKRVKEETFLNLGDEVKLFITEEELKSYQETKKQVKAMKQFKIAYEDDNILIAEKPFGLLTHGDQTEKKNHLANQVIAYLIEKKEYDPRIDRTFSPASVNRLDRNTTGLVLFGKNARALQDLNYMIREKDFIKKYYLTIVAGKLEKELELKDKMIKDSHNNTVAVIDENSDIGKTMETKVKPISFGKYKDKWYTLCEVNIITGRTHQIRAHLAKAGYPVIGDSKYGLRSINQIIEHDFKWTTQLLHAYKLEFNKIKDDSPLKYLEGKTFKASLPMEFERIRGKIFNEREF